MARITKTYEINTENIRGEFEKLDWQAGLSEKEQRMLSVYGEIKDEHEKRQIILNIKKLNELNAELQSINGKINLIDTLNDQDIEKTKFKQAIKDILREKNRIIQLEVVSKKWSDKSRDILKWKNIDAISARDLLLAENEDTWFLAKTFAYKLTKDETWEESETPVIRDDIKEKDIIKIDFGKNKNANYKIWAADILPASVKIVKIIDYKGKEIIWTRDIAWNKVGYYDENNKYIPIFNNYKIYIPSSDELKNTEYSKFGLKSVFASVSELKDLEKNEKEAKTRYISELELNEKADIVKDTVFKLSSEVWDLKPYKNKINAMLNKASEYKSKKNFSVYSEDALDLAITRLTKTKEIIWDKDFDFDWDKYKEAIASHESGGSYFARNDNLGRKKGISSEKWAFGKYQFTTETLRWYWVDLWAPDEDKIQAFLSNSALQEEIMDKNMLTLIEKKILVKPNIVSSMESKEHSLNYYLALCHIGWPGTLSNANKSDWRGTSVTKYACWVEDLALAA